MKHSLLVVALATSVGIVSAQGPTFEVASVKPNKSGDARASFGGRPDGGLCDGRREKRRHARRAATTRGPVEVLVIDQATQPSPD